MILLVVSWQTKYGEARKALYLMDKESSEGSEGWGYKNAVEPLFPGYVGAKEILSHSSSL